MNRINYTTKFDKKRIDNLKEYILNLSLGNFNTSEVFKKNKLNLNGYTSVKDLISRNNELFGELSLINPEKYREFKELIDKNAIENLKKISGKSIYLNGINIRVSFKSENKLNHQYLFHRDRDAFEVFKYFIYLTDVEKVNGPLRFLENSYKQKFSEIFKHRFDDTYINKYYKFNNLIDINGDSGTSFICCTNSFHKQGENNGSYRILVTFKFGIKNWKNINYFNSEYVANSKELNYNLGS